MLAQGIVIIRTLTKQRAQKVRRLLAIWLTFLACTFVLVVIDWARVSTASADAWEHDLSVSANEMTTETATAMRFKGATDPEGFPVDSAWAVATPVRFSTDWQGLKADPERETEVRLLWTQDT